MAIEDKVAVGAGCFIILIWLLAVVLGLGVSAAIIYFLYQAASGNVF